MGRADSEAFTLLPSIYMTKSKKKGRDREEYDLEMSASK